MKYSEKYTITSHDVDTNNNLRPSMVFRYMQETANHHMRDRRPSYDELFAEGKSFILTRISVEIYEQIHQYEEIEVKTWRCPEKAATFIRCWSIEHDGRIMARAYSEWAVANRNTGKLCRASEVDISNYDTDEPVELEIATRFRLPKLDFSRVGERTVHYSDVDMNMHMNNTNYPNMICDYIPLINEREITSINLRFMAEGTLGEDLEIYMAKGEKLDSRAKEMYYFFTKINGRTNIEAEIGVKDLEVSGMDAWLAREY